MRADATRRPRERAKFMRCDQHTSQTNHDQHVCDILLLFFFLLVVLANVMFASKPVIKVKIVPKQQAQPNQPSLPNLSR